MRKKHFNPRGSFIKKRGEGTSWNKVAGWYDRLIEEREHDMQRDVIMPRALKLVDPKCGEKILDIGCGQGALSREIAGSGADVTGIDSSRKLVEIARSRAHGKGNLHYFVSDARKLSGIKDESFDQAYSVLALQNMDPLDAVIKEASRVLKKCGRLSLVMNHPCFRIPRQSGWGFDEKRKLQYRRVDHYMSPLKIPIQMHPGSSPDVHTWTFHKPLSEYFNALFSSGFVIGNLEEWTSQRESRPGERAKAENLARREIPLFLALSAVKLDGERKCQN